jgi:hypothetical protein
MGLLFVSRRRYELHGNIELHASRTRDREEKENIAARCDQLGFLRDIELSIRTIDRLLPGARILRSAGRDFANAYNICKSEDLLGLVKLMLLLYR